MLSTDRSPAEKAVGVVLELSAVKAQNLLTALTEKNTKQQPSPAAKNEKTTNPWLEHFKNGIWQVTTDPVCHLRLTCKISKSIFAPDKKSGETGCVRGETQGRHGASRGGASQEIIY